MKNCLTIVICLLCASRGLCTAYSSWDSFTNVTVVKGGNITVNGWGADSSSGTSGIVANVYVDGAFAIQVAVSLPRPDVASAYGRSDFTNSGFSASFSTAALSLGSHTVDIWIGGGPSGWIHYTQAVVNHATSFTVTNIAPTISWRNPSSHALPISFPTANTNYTVQATGYSSTGTLASVNVWRDGVPFAFNGVSSPYTQKTTDGNIVNEPAGTLHIFSAQATTTDGLHSPIIYWVTKVAASGITYADLQTSTIKSANPNGTNNPWLPNTGEFDQNSTTLDTVITSLGGNTTAGKVLEFSDSTYEFGAPVNGGHSEFSNVANLTLTGGPAGKSQLVWAIRDSNGIPYDPSTYPSYFQTSGGVAQPYNPYPISNTYQPHGFWLFDGLCTNILISNLTFDTDYTIRIGGEGSHIKMAGNTNRITNCTFYHATGFAIFVGQTGAANNITVDSNRIYNNWADGIHVVHSNGVTISGNSISGSGDDAIAITCEGGYSNTVGSVSGNSIQSSHYRGILILGVSNIDIENNYISGTASSGISLEPYTDPVSGAVTWNNCIQLQNNYVENTGQVNAHNYGSPVGGGFGYYLGYTHNLHANFTPRSDAPLHLGVKYAAFHVNSTPSPTPPTPNFAGAYVDNVDNNPTTGSPYTYLCEHTNYLAWNATDGGGGSYASNSTIPTTP